MTPPPRLETFPIRAECSAASVGFMPLAQGLREALGLPGDTKISGGAWLTSVKEGTKLEGGLRVLGTKRRAFRGAKVDVVCVSIAAFDSKGTLAGWSRDLVAGAAEDPPELRFSRPDGSPVELTVEMKKKLKSLATAEPVANEDSQSGKPSKRAARPATDSQRAKTREAPVPFIADADIVHVALTADGQIASTLDRTNTLSFWDMRDGSRIAKVAIQKGTGAQAFSPDGQRIAVGRTKVEIRYVGAPEADVVLTGHPKGEVVALGWSPDGARVVSLSAVPVKGADNALASWDAATGAQLFRVPVHRPNGMLVSRKGKAIVCGTYEGLVSISAKTGETLATAFAGERIEELAEVADGVLVMLGQSLDDGELVVVHPETLVEVRRTTLEGLLYPAVSGSAVIGRNEDRSALVLGDAKKSGKLRSKALGGELGPYAIANQGATIVCALGPRLVVLGKDLAPRP